MKTERFISEDNAHCGGLHLIRLVFTRHRLACGLGHAQGLTAVSRLSFKTLAPLRYPQGEGFRLGANILRQTLIYRYVYTFGTTHRSFPTDKMLRHRHLPLRGRVVPYGISILFVRLIIVLGDDSTKGFPLRGSWRGTRLMRCSRPQTALSFHTHKVTVS